MKARVRVMPVIAVTSSGRRIVLAAETGESYASKVKLLLEALKEVDSTAFNGAYLIADRCYDSVEVMEKLRKLKINPAIRIKETFRKGVRHPLKKESKILWDK